MRADAKRGSALLEAVIGMALLAIGGSAMLGALGQTRRTLRDVAETERRVDEAGAALSGLVELDGSSLATRIGRRTVRGWTIGVDQIGNGLFGVEISDSSGHTVLQTTLYRPLAHHER